MTAVPQVKAALVGVLQNLFPPPALVSYGDPGVNQPETIIAVMGGRVIVERPTMGTGRAREEIIEVDLVISQWASGGDTRQQAATEAAMNVVTQLDSYLRVKPNETLSGACREAWLSGWSWSETNSADVDSGNVAGQVAEINAVLAARARL
jgi:hypothetical protein